MLSGLRLLTCGSAPVTGDLFSIEHNDIEVGFVQPLKLNEGLVSAINLFSDKFQLGVVQEMRISNNTLAIVDAVMALPTVSMAAISIAFSYSESASQWKLLNVSNNNVTKFIADCMLLQCFAVSLFSQNTTNLELDVIIANNTALHVNTTLAFAAIAVGAIVGGYDTQRVANFKFDATAIGVNPRTLVVSPNATKAEAKWHVRSLTVTGNSFHMDSATGEVVCIGLFGGLVKYSGFVLVSDNTCRVRFHPLPVSVLVQQQYAFPGYKPVNRFYGLRVFRVDAKNLVDYRMSDYPTVPVEIYATMQTREALLIFDQGGLVLRNCLFEILGSAALQDAIAARGGSAAAAVAAAAPQQIVNFVGVTSFASNSGIEFPSNAPMIENVTVIVSSVVDAFLAGQVMGSVRSSTGALSVRGRAIPSSPASQPQELSVKCVKDNNKAQQILTFPQLSFSPFTDTTADTIIRCPAALLRTLSP